jgi:hypothetical protein
VLVQVQEALKHILEMACQADSRNVEYELTTRKYSRRSGHDPPPSNRNDLKMPLYEEGDGRNSDQELQRMILLDVFVSRLDINVEDFLRKCVQILAMSHSSCDLNTASPRRERTLLAFATHLLRTGALYVDILRDVCSLCSSHYLKLDMVQLVIAQAHLLGNSEMVKRNLKFKRGLVHHRALSTYHQSIQYLLQKDANFACLDEILYFNVIMPCHRRTVLDIEKSNEFCTLALETIKVVQEQDGKFDLFALRDWEGMYGWTEQGGFYSDCQCWHVNFSGFLENRRRLGLPSLSLIEDELWKLAPPDEMVLLRPELMSGPDSRTSIEMEDRVEAESADKIAYPKRENSRMDTNFDKIFSRLRQKLDKRARFVASNPYILSTFH